MSQPLALGQWVRSQHQVLLTLGLRISTNTAEAETAEGFDSPVGSGADSRTPSPSTPAVKITPIRIDGPPRLHLAAPTTNATRSPTRFDSHFVVPRPGEVRVGRGPQNPSARPLRLGNPGTHSPAPRRARRRQAHGVSGAPISGPTPPGGPAGAEFSSSAASGRHRGALPRPAERGSKTLPIGGPTPSTGTSGRGRAGARGCRKWDALVPLVGLGPAMRALFASPVSFSAKFEFALIGHHWSDLRRDEMRTEKKKKKKKKKKYSALI
eukprot:Polyplicarium_translucidae@DN2181_c0_g1_i1.p1